MPATVATPACARPSSRTVTVPMDAGGGEDRSGGDPLAACASRTGDGP
ncbi:hypothetical protein [Microbispora rosea]